MQNKRTLTQQTMRRGYHMPKWSSSDYSPHQCHWRRCE